MTRIYEGIRPPAPSYLTGAATINSQRWELYTMLAVDRPEDEHWLNLKLVAVPGRETKANYRFGWHTSAERFNWSRDYQRLREHLPDVERWVTAVLRGDPALTLIWGS